MTTTMTTEPVSGEERPRPLRSLVASARRLTKERIRTGGRNSNKPSTWQEDAWDMYDLVGEYRYLVNRLAGTSSQAKFFIGRMETWDSDPMPVSAEEQPEVSGLLRNIGGTSAGLAQIIERLTINLRAPGEGWIVGIPRDLLEEEVQGGLWESLLDPDGPDAENMDDEGYVWKMLSINEVESVPSTGEVVLHLGPGEEERLSADPDELHLIRVWKPHPRRAWEADSSTRAALPVLRELVGLTMHISAQVDSRLAGAGMLVIPQSAQRAFRAMSGLPEDSTEDPFTEALMEAMITPIRDRGSASALVPLVIAVPDETVNLFNHITFSQPLDAEARSLREEAIRRLALSLDAPPELLLGTASMNHWGSWLVQEDTIRSHVEPMLALICDALTTQYLWPELIDGLGMDPAEAQRYVVWYDVEHMIVRPSRDATARELFDRGAITSEALLRESGFDSSDAPEEAEELDPAVTMALDLVRSAPTLAQSPGLPALTEQIRLLLAAGEDGRVEEGEIPVSADGVPTAAPSDSAPAAGETPPPAEMPTEVGDAQVPEFAP